VWILVCVAYYNMARAYNTLVSLCTLFHVQCICPSGTLGGVVWVLIASHGTILVLFWVHVVFLRLATALAPLPAPKRCWGRALVPRVPRL
jgi:hypothetical protein